MMGECSHSRTVMNRVPDTVPYVIGVDWSGREVAVAIVNGRVVDVACLICHDTCRVVGQIIDGSESEVWVCVVVVCVGPSARASDGSGNHRDTGEVGRNFAALRAAIMMSLTRIATACRAMVESV